MDDLAGGWSDVNSDEDTSAALQDQRNTFSTINGSGPNNTQAAGGAPAGLLGSIFGTSFNDVRTSLVSAATSRIQGAINGAKAGAAGTATATAATPASKNMMLVYIGLAVVLAYFIFRRR